MSTAEAAKFSCAACGKQYRWKPEMAGKKAKCKCGAAVQVPTTDPAKAAAPVAPGDEPNFDDVYALAAAEAEHAAAANEAAAPQVAPAPPTAAPRTGPAATAAYAGTLPRRAKIDNTPSSAERWHNFWRGLGYMFVGLLIVGYGVFEFVVLKQLEEEGGRHRMRIWVRFIYAVAGKWGVLVVIGGLGVLTMLGGVLAMFGKLDTDNDD